MLTDKAKLLEMAERVERASGPDPELDEMVRLALFGPTGAFVEQSPFNGAWCIYEIGFNGKKRLWEPRNLSKVHRTGAFTASIDAALTLVPEGWMLAVEQRRCSRQPWCVNLYSYDDGREVSLKAPTLAGALCAAALKARALLSEASHAEG